MDPVKERVERKPRRMRPEQRRDDLIASALALFARRPHHQVTPEDVAAEADVSRALFYRYFSSMEELYLAALGVVTDGLSTRLLPAEDAPLEGLARHLVEEFFSFAEQYPTPYIAMFSRGHVVAAPEAYELLDRARTRVIEETVRRTGGPISPYLTLTLRSWISLLEGTALTWLKHREPPRTELLDWVTAQLDAMLAVSAATGDAASERFRRAVAES